MKNVKLLLICNFLLFFSYNIKSQFINSNRWDNQIIEEAEIWKNLLVGYIYEDHKTYWPIRKEALTRLISDYPKSEWADDAELLLAGEKAIFDNNIKEAINDLREPLKTCFSQTE